MTQIEARYVIFQEQPEIQSGAAKCGLILRLRMGYNVTLDMNNYFPEGEFVWMVCCYSLLHPSEISRLC